MTGHAPLDLSRRDARRVAIAAQGLAGPRPAGRKDRRHFRSVLDRLATVQIDSVNVLTRSHELVFFARLGAYDRDALTRWLWGSREVFEYLTQLCERQGLPLFNAFIKSSVRFHEAPNERTPLILLHPELEGAKAYVEVAQEVANA